MSTKDVCPVSQTHKCLLEAHRLWHQAKEAYFDPEGFRTNLNAAIQAIRNVTFKVQYEKSKIPEFEAWYAIWVERLSGDEKMHWLNKSRVGIVHNEDLKLHSIAEVSICNYVQILKMKMEFPIFLDAKMLLVFLVERNYIDEHMLKIDAFAKIDRQWRVNDFPTVDVLSILAYAIGILYQLVKEAHERGGIEFESCSIRDTMHTMEMCNGEISCLQLPSKFLSEAIRLRDMKNRHFILQAEKMKSGAKLPRRYKNVFPEQNASYPDPFVFAERLADTSKRLLLKDGHHGAMLFYKSKDDKWVVISVEFNSRADKFMFWHRFAEEVKEKNIIAFIFISESWVASMDSYLETGLLPGEQEKAEEALIVDAISNDMQIKRYTTVFTRNRIGKIKLSQTVFEEYLLDEESAPGYYTPIINVWREKKQA